MPESGLGSGYPLLSVFVEGSLQSTALPGTQTRSSSTWREGEAVSLCSAHHHHHRHHHPKPLSHEDHSHWVKAERPTKRKMFPQPRTLDDAPLHPTGSSRCPAPALLTRPNSDDQLTTMVLGTVAERRARGVMLMGRLGLLGSAPFLVGGR